MLQALCYCKENGVEKITDAKGVARVLKNARSLVWADITNPEEDDIDLLVDTFAFHQLAIEDALFPQYQPKMDDYDDYLHIIVHELNYPSRSAQEVKSQELNILVGKNYVVTIHSEPLPSVSKLFQRCQNKPHSMHQGSGFLLHAIIDNVVDNYFPVVDQMENKIEQLEDQVLAKADQSVLESIVDLKKSVLTIRNFIVPQRKILGLLCRASTPFIKRAMSAYFRDVYDHVVRVSELLDTYRDVLNSTMDAYLSVVSHRMNEIMKTLTIITTIMMPLTVITSFYGMNVELPEFAWGLKGYLLVLGLMVCALGGMIIFLKRKKWI
ncbi:magnesium/cobalt transporter CorA [candidate division FCPU426 bacterium]|nr:magnesium/cobalt transporter CorA [candidate division FCPU426 bacterium]